MLSMKKIPFIFISLILFTSCFTLPVEETVPPPPFLHTPGSAAFRTVEVRRGTVRRFIDMTANYVPAQEEALSFAIGGEYISAVYVDIGDIVEAGDILAELDRTVYQDELERLARDEEWTRLNLAQLDDRYELRLEEALVTGVQADEAAYYDERSGLTMQLETIRLRKEYLEFEDERRVLRAGLSGMVMSAIAWSEGMQSVADRNIFTIADQSMSVFMVRGPDTVHMEMGAVYDITIQWEPYSAVVVDAEAMGIARAREGETYLMLVGEEPAVLSSRTFATVHLTLDAVEDVLFVPFTAVRKANARIFVYVLENGIRTIRDVEIGLEGNLVTEIVSGLQEGELIIQE
jgi:multidrug efflux pump subunit AcrA (membrane-fusion protein)